MSAAASFKYRRLPGRGRRTQGPVAVTAAISTLWLGPDHLLSVDRIWMNEEFKRFYFRDIQAITLEKTAGRRTWNLIYGGLALLTAFIFGGIVAMNSTPYAARITAACVAAFWLLPILINSLRGPRCICRLQTAVQAEALPSLKQVRKAKRVIGILKPLIEGEQGALLPGDVENLLAQPRPVAPVRKPGPPLPPPKPLALRQYGGILHGVFFLVMLIDSATGLYSIIRPAWHMSPGLGMLLTLVMIGLNVTALVRQQESTIPKGLQRLTLIALVINLVMLFATFALLYANIAGVLLPALQHRSVLPRHGSYHPPGYQAFILIENLVELAMVIMGFVLLSAYRLGRREKPAPAATVQEQAP